MNGAGGITVLPSVVLKALRWRSCGKSRRSGREGVAVGVGAGGGEGIVVQSERSEDRRRVLVEVEVRLMLLLLLRLLELLAGAHATRGADGATRAAHQARVVATAER